MPWHWAEEIAVRTPNVVVTSLGPLMEATCAVYEGEDLVDGSDAMQVINLKGDALARTHMARICAHVVHADQGSLSADSPGGKHFWRMLVLLISQDESDMVRFAALNALSGNVVSSADGVLGPTTLGKSRDPLAGATATSKVMADACVASREGGARQCRGNERIEVHRSRGASHSAGAE